MPDRDIISSALPRGWQTPSRLLQAGSPPAAVAEALIHSLCRTLRQLGGIPRFDAVVRVVEEVAEGRLRFLEAGERLAEIEATSDGHRLTKIACEAAHGMASELEQGGSADPDLSVTLAFGFLQKAVSHFFFGPLACCPTGSGFAKGSEILGWERDCGTAAMPALEHLAAQIARRPNAEGLRAPRRARNSRPSTEELLGQPIGL